MTKKAYSTPSTVEHGSASTMTLGGGITNSEGALKLSE